MQVKLYGFDNEPRSPSDAPQDEDNIEIDQLFRSDKEKKKSVKSAAEIALLVENVMAKIEVVAEEDAELNRQSKLAINKLKKLPLLMEVLSKKLLHHGVLTLLKTWLKPLLDGSLPNINICAAILRILTDFPIDLEHYDRREQLKKSSLGKVIMFLLKSDEETTANRRMTKALVDKWSTQFEDIRNFDDEKVPFWRPSAKKYILSLFNLLTHKSGQSSSMLLTLRPEAMPMDFLVRPQSKIDPDEVRACAKQVVQDQHRLKMQKKLQQLKAPKKKQLQATKPSVEGRGMVKYLVVLSMG
ncbi:hypothetical protein CsSME_00020591 [Camellia sinensis var. sinensis]